MSKANDIATWGQYAPKRKNIIINGDSRVWQRGTSFPASASNFFADRFQWVKAGVGVVTLSRDPVVSGSASFEGKVGYAMKIDVTTADASIAAGDVYGIRYPIEAQDMEHLSVGTADAQTVTLSFWVASGKTGIHSGSLRNAAADRSYVFEYTVNAVATWEYKTVTIDLDTTGTWLKDNNLGMDIFFSIATGTTFQGTVDAWTAGNFVGSVNQVNVMDDTANNFWLTNVQLEVGTEATDFENRPFGEELALCQRYYSKSYSYETAPGTVTAAGTVAYTAARTATQQYISPFAYPATMRITPTLTIYGSDGVINRITGIDSANLVAGSFAFNDNHVRVITTTSAHVLHDRYLFQWTMDAEI